MRSVIRTTPPAAEPLNLAEAKLHLRINGSDDNTVISNLISVARMACEEYTRRALVTQGWTLNLDDFPGQSQQWWDGSRDGVARLSVKRFIQLSRPPLVSVTSVSTFDDDDNETVFAATNYFVDTASEPGRLALRNNAVWPEVQRQSSGIKIVYVAGYGDAAAVPLPLKQGMLVHIAQMYECRGDWQDAVAQARAIKLLPDVAAVLYQPYRLPNLVQP